MKNVLFVCVENACRSQIGEAFFRKFADGKALAKSAGVEPSKEVNPKAVAVMREVGIDINRRKPKLLTTDMVKEADRVVTMGCGADACPVLPDETEDWQTEDPSGKSIDKFREIREEIKRRVEELIEELGLR